MKFDELVQFYQEEIESGELFEGFSSIIDNELSRVEESGDKERVVEVYSENPNALYNHYDESWRVHNNFDQELMNYIEYIEENITDENVRKDLDAILESFMVLDNLKISLGMIKPVVENNVRMRDVSPEDMRAFTTPIKESFRSQYYRDHQNLIENPDIVDKQELIDLYCRGSETLFDIRHEEIKEGDLNLNDGGRKLTEDEKNELAEEYGEIVWTVDKLLTLDNFTEDLYLYQLRGLADFRMREVLSDYLDVPVSEPYEMKNELENSYTDVDGETPLTDVSEEYTMKSRRLLEKLNVDLESVVGGS